MNALLLLPIIIPLGTAAVLVMCLRLGPRTQGLISLCGAGLLFATGLWLLHTVLGGGIMVTQVGGWPAPFGISFVADTLGAAMVAITGFIALMVLIFALEDLPKERVRQGAHPLIHILLMGVCGAFLTGDLFNLFVWFEVMLMASFVLLAMGGSRGETGGAVKYLVLNFLASGFFLTALGLLYGQMGTLNMADLAMKLQSTQDSGLVITTAMLLMLAFGLKAGLFPVFAWLPASYHTPSVTVSALFAGLLTKVGVYALIRAFALIFTTQTAVTHTTLLVLSLLTMVAGVLGAASQFEIRRILSWHIISQIGYMVLGLALFTQAALTATVFYIIHHIIVKTNLFLISGAVVRLRGSDRLKEIGGLYKAAPWLSLLFLVPAMSLGGIPPLSGFFAKFSLLIAGFESQAYFAMAVALAVGLLTLYSMTKIWAEAFWKADPHGDSPTPSLPIAMMVPIVAMATLTLGISFAPQILLEISQAAAAELIKPDAYIRAVLGSRP